MGLTGAQEREIRAKNGGYLHGEAYCLMRYRCKQCVTDEILWNSRDGVTPFDIACRHCGGEASHIDWRNDRRTRDYKPTPDQRIFVDRGHAAAYDYALRIYERMMASEYRRDDITKEEFVRSVLKDVPLGDPHVTVVEADGV